MAGLCPLIPSLHSLLKLGLLSAVNHLAASGSISYFVMCLTIALKVFSSSSSVGFDTTVVSLRFLFVTFGILHISFSLFGSSCGDKAYLVLAFLASAPGDVEKDEEFNPGDAADLGVWLCRCPFPFFEEAVHVLVEHLALGEPTVSLRGSYQLHFLVVNFQMAFAPYFRIGFDPLARVVSKEGLLDGVDPCSSLLFRLWWLQL